MRAEFNLNREQATQLYCVKDRNPKFPYHFHSHIELYLVHSGEMEVWIKDRREIIGAGEISVALSFDPHGYNTPASCEATVLIIPTGFCEDFLEAVRHKRLGSPIIREKAFYDELNCYCNELLAGCNEIKKRGCVYMILGALLDRMQPEAQAPTADPAPASRILLYINEHYTKPLTLASIAAELGYNASYLSRCFKNFFHMGINRYITLMRLRKAVLLMQHKKSIATSAYESGFNSVRTFYRAFCEEFQCTPKEYLKGLSK